MKVCDSRTTIGHDEYFQLFELAEGRIAGAGFNSCHDNDCYAFHGCIPDSAIAEAHLQLQSRRAQYDLMVAEWYHNVEGAPYVSDYMPAGLSASARKRSNDHPIEPPNRPKRLLGGPIGWFRHVGRPVQRYRSAA